MKLLEDASDLVPLALAIVRHLCHRVSVEGEIVFLCNWVNFSQIILVFVIICGFNQKCLQILFQSSNCKSCYVRLCRHLLWFLLSLILCPFLTWYFVAAVTCVVTTESMLESEKVRQDLEFAK